MAREHSQTEPTRRIVNRRKSYDPRCYDLAELFLDGEPELNTPERISELAQEIQDCIEGYIRGATS